MPRFPQPGHMAWETPWTQCWAVCWAEHGCNTLAEHGCPGEGRCRWCVVLAKHLFTEAVVGRSSTLAPTQKQPHQLR